MQVCTRVPRNEALGQQYYEALDQLLTAHQGKPLTQAFFKAVKEVVAMEGRETCFGVPVIELAVKLIKKVIYTYFLLHRNSISPSSACFLATNSPVISLAPSLRGSGVQRPTPHAQRPTFHAQRHTPHAQRATQHAQRPTPHANFVTVPTVSLPRFYKKDSFLLCFCRRTIQEC